MHGIRERVTSPLSAAEATLLGRIAAARGSAVASLRACVAPLCSGALATALARLAGAAGAGAEIVHCGGHRKLLVGGGIRRTLAVRGNALCWPAADRD